MSEPTNIWTKSYQVRKHTYDLEASIVYDIGPQGDMFEGVICIQPDNTYSGESFFELSNAQTFDEESDALDFINNSVAELGYDLVLWLTQFKIDSPPKDLLEIESIRKSYQITEEN